jgi:hypothetical protein
MVSPKLVLAVLLVFAGVGLAHAGGKVDWSDYLEPAGSRPMQIKHESATPTPAADDDGAARKAAPTTVASKGGKAKAAAKTKGKAKAGKSKAKARKRR